MTIDEITDDLVVAWSAWTGYLQLLEILEISWNFNSSWKYWKYPGISVVLLEIAPVQVFGRW